MADVALGFLLTHDPAAGLPWGLFALLLGASVCLYEAGMALNDVFDVEIDRQERPDRPIPSGRVPLRLASLLGFELLLVGAVLGWTASYVGGGVLSGIVASGLALAVLLYDKVLKKTPLAPLAMGGCRFLNVLLGASAIEGSWPAAVYLVAGGVGLYITGVTWFARTEARQSARPALAGGVLVMALGIAMLAGYPTLAASGEAPLVLALLSRWYGLLAILGLIVVGRSSLAIFDPSPGRVQIAVKQCLLSLIVLDATVCLAARGVEPAVCILALLAPTVFLGRWVYST